MRSCLVRLLIIVGALLAAIGILALVFYARSARHQAEVERSWVALLGGKSFLERYPATATNVTALRLEALAERLGVDLAQPSVGDRLQGEEAARFKEIGDSLKEHSRRIAHHEGGPLPALPPELAAFLAAARAPLAETVTLLLASEAPAWERDLTRGAQAPLPNLLGILHLQRLLLVRAAEQARAGDEEAALHTLDASWRLNEAVFEGPSLIEQLIAQGALDGQLPLLGGLCSPPRIWAERLAGLELRPRALVALYAEGFWIEQTASLPQPLAPQFPQKPGEEEPEVPSFLLPLVRWGMRDHVWRWNAMLEKLPRQDVRTLNSQAFFQAEFARVPRWQIVSRLLMPNFLDVWTRTVRRELAVERTALVLEERARIGARRPAASERRPSLVSGLDWLIERTTEGATIRLDGDLADPGKDPTPLRYALSSADCPLQASRRPSR